MNKRIFTLLLSVLLSVIGVQAAEPLDTVLTRLDEKISECLDDATRLDEGLALIRQALAMKGVEQSKLYPVMLFHEGTYYMNSGDMDRCKQNRLHLLQMLPVADYPELSISVPQDLGLVYRREGLCDSAFYYYDVALDEALKQNDTEWLAAISANVGILHFNLNHFSEAARYLDRGLQYVRQVDDPYTQLCILQAYGAAKLALDKPAEAKPLLSEAFQMACEAESPDWQVRCLTTMLKVYNRLEQADSARYCVSQGSELLRQLPPHSINAIGFVTARASYYYDNQQWEQALRDFQTVMAGNGRGVKTAKLFENIARCYGQLGRWREAFCYMDSARIEADTLASEKLAAQMAEFNVKYQTMEKELEITRLQTQRTWFVFLGVLALLVLAGLWLWYRQRRQRREAEMRIATLETERKRIAKELHDGLCNDMLALEMQMSDNVPDETLASLRSLRQQARLLSHQLMPPEFSHLSLSQLLSQYVASIDKTTALSASFTATPDAFDESWQNVPAKISHEVYRIVQEHTSNIVKGGTATLLSVHLMQSAPDRYQLCVIDDGQPPAADSPAEGLGRHTQQDRIVSIGASSKTYRQDDRNHLELEFSV